MKKFKGSIIVVAMLTMHATTIAQTGIFTEEERIAFCRKTPTMDLLVTYTSIAGGLYSVGSMWLRSIYCK